MKVEFKVSKVVVDNNKTEVGDILEFEIDDNLIKTK